MKRILLSLLGLFCFCIVRAQSCLPDGITFDSQESIDNFASNYPLCTEIEGDVTIEEYVNDLSGLSMITSIGGDLEVINNSTLLSMEGLNNLNYIGGNTSISSNPKLISLDNLPSLIFINAFWKPMKIVMARIWWCRIVSRR